jgi:hypothetical protein
MRHPMISFIVTLLALAFIGYLFIFFGAYGFASVINSIVSIALIILALAFIGALVTAALSVTLSLLPVLAVIAIIIFIVQRFNG